MVAIANRANSAFNFILMFEETIYENKDFSIENAN